MPPFKPVLEAFNERYIPEPNSGCWLWESGLNSNGYGILFCGGYRGYAHRFSYAHFKGPIPDGMYVCHSCDVPSCVNPDHLWLGTQVDNMRDCRRKGRHRDPTTFSKLDWSSIRQIRELAGSMSQAKIAARFHIDQSSVSRILARKEFAERSSGGGECL